MGRHRPGWRNARKRKVKVNKLIQRDGLYCVFCGLLINPKLPGDDPLSLTIEHVVPLRMGGSSRLDNLRLAHRRCNNTAGEDFQW